MPCWCKTTCNGIAIWVITSAKYTSVLQVICEHCPYVQFFSGHGTGKAIKSHGISNLAIRHVAAHCPHLQRHTVRSSRTLRC
jgi:hypothetical protein